MYYYKITLEYDGTHYAGFQWQKGVSSVQNELNLAISQFANRKFSTSSASRTDTGVHALCQVVRICTETPIDLPTFLHDTTIHLPPDIRIKTIGPCERTFVPSSAAKSKEYRYLFTNKIQVSKEESRFVANFSKHLDFYTMKYTAMNLAGEHDFCNFCSSGSNVKSTTRKITFCELSVINPHDLFPSTSLFNLPTELRECYQLKIVGHGFLKQMIRHIISGLWMVGSGKLNQEEFLQLLNSPKSKKQLWKVAPPNGLFLYHIHFEEENSHFLNTNCKFN